MAMQKEAKRVKYGTTLNQYATQGQSSVDVLTMLKSNLATLKTTVQGDSDFVVADAAEITAVQNSLKTQIQTLID